jgi:RNA polymerase sigma factor (sigma-70 family)
MPGPSVTRASLLLRIQDPNNVEAWRQFVDVYASMIYGFLRKRGLQDADAADLVQEVLRSVSAHAGRLNYDPARGTFRSWLYTVTRNKMYNFLESRKRHVRGTGDTSAHEALGEQAIAEDETEKIWQQEYERKAFAWAVEQVRDEFQEQTWNAFWQTAVDGKSPKDVAGGLNMSVGAVYVAKSRVLARLREQILRLQEE